MTLIEVFHQTLWSCWRDSSAGRMWAQHAQIQSPTQHKPGMRIHHDDACSPSIWEVVETERSEFPGQRGLYETSTLKQNMLTSVRWFRERWSGCGEAFGAMRIAQTFPFWNLCPVTCVAAQHPCSKDSLRTPGKHLLGWWHPSQERTLPFWLSSRTRIHPLLPTELRNIWVLWSLAIIA